MLKVLNNRGQNGDHYNSQNQELKVLLNQRKLTKKITAVTEKPYPKCSARYIEEDESTITHGTDTCNKWSKSSDNGYEASDYNSFTAIFFKKHIGFSEMLRIEKARLIVLKYFGTNPLTNLVVQSIA